MRAKLLPRQVREDVLAEILVDERLVLLQPLQGLHLRPPISVEEVLQLLLKRSQFLRLLLGHGPAAVGALGAHQVRGQQRGAAFGGARRGRESEDAAFLAIRALEAAAIVVHARRAEGAIAPELLRLVELHAPRRRGLQQAALRQVRDAHFVADLDLPAATQNMVPAVVMPHRVGPTRVRHEGGKEVRGVALRVIRILKAVQDPDLD
mmetsp:Transcript_84255/g.257293  ORF Transcript_84255/g.257293 Transcript_84255/m.257293 type:complete len:207 (+) Transcript_84255:312-932(+)